jgi:hypothetical protein
MKKFYTLFIALLMAGSAITQTDDPCESCLPDGITFETQAQIDSFQNNYPGCTVIEGDVIIDGWNINNLLGLSVLTAIEGNLQILDNTDSLDSLSGLDNVVSIGGSLRFNNTPLISLNGLNNLSFT